MPGEVSVTKIRTRYQVYSTAVVGGIVMGVGF